MPERDPSRRRPRDPERSRASGDDGASERSIFEILDAPLPSELAPEGAEPPPAGTPAPSERFDDPPRRRPQPAPLEPEPFVDPPATFVDAPPSTAPRRRTPVPRSRRSAGAAPARRVRRTIKQLDPMSILKVSLFFYTFFLLVWLVMVALFYNFLDGLGLFDQLESLGEDLVLPALQNDITLGTVEKWALVIGIGCVIVGSLINAFLAFLYNLIADLVGGINITFTERDQ